MTNALSLPPSLSPPLLFYVFNKLLFAGSSALRSTSVYRNTNKSEVLAQSLTHLNPSGYGVVHWIPSSSTVSVICRYKHTWRILVREGEGNILLNEQNEIKNQREEGNIRHTLEMLHLSKRYILTLQKALLFQGEGGLEFAK